MSGLMFTRMGSWWRWRKAACGARSGNMAGSRTRQRRCGGWLASWARQGAALRFCYEAGPCGYGIQRQLSALGHECIVVAPALIPKRAGDGVKTDRRDGTSLAKLHRAGKLTAVWVPDPGHEAMRDLVRARLDAVRALRRALNSFRGFAAPRLPIRAAGMDKAASPLAGGAQVGAGGIISCSRTTLRQSKPPRRGAIG